MASTASAPLPHASAVASLYDSAPEDVEDADDFTADANESVVDDVEDFTDSSDEEASGITGPGASADRSARVDANVAWVRAHLLRSATWLTRHHAHWNTRTAKQVAGSHGVDKLESALRRGESAPAALLAINWDSSNTHRVKHALAEALRDATHRAGALGHAGPTATSTAGTRKPQHASFVPASKLHDATAMFRMVQGYNKQLCIPFVERAAEDAGFDMDVAEAAWAMVRGCPIRAVLRISRASASDGAHAHAVAASVLRRLAQDAANDNE